MLIEKKIYYLKKTANIPTIEFEVETKISNDRKERLEKKKWTKKFQ